MEKMKVKIIDPIGIHAKVAANIVNIASQYTSDITIVHEGRSANMKSILNILALGIASNEEIEVTISGSDEALAYQGLAHLFEDNQIGQIEYL